jgi:hypothetical protein
VLARPGRGFSEEPWGPGLVLNFFEKKGWLFDFVSNERFLKEKIIGLVVGSNFLDCWFSRLMVLSFMRRIGFGLKARLGLGF